MGTMSKKQSADWALVHLAEAIKRSHSGKANCQNAVIKKEQQPEAVPPTEEPTAPLTSPSPKDNSE